MIHNRDHLEGIKILFAGVWSAADVCVTEIPSTRATHESLETKLMHAWKQTLANAEKQQKKIWDSILYRFEKSIVDATYLKLQFSTIPFSIRLEMNAYTTEIKELGEAFAPLGLFSSCLVKTVDGYIVCIKKSQLYVTKKRYAWVGGVLSKSEAKIETGVDLFDQVSREITEELGVQKEHITEITLRAGYITENWNTCLLFSAQLSITKVELLHYFEHSDDEAEHLLVFTAEEEEIILPLFEEKDQVKFALLEVF